MVLALGALGRVEEHTMTGENLEFEYLPWRRLNVLAVTEYVIRKNGI
jgi:hypothetical protein